MLAGCLLEMAAHLLFRVLIAALLFIVGLPVVLAASLFGVGSYSERFGFRFSVLLRLCGRLMTA